MEIFVISNPKCVETNRTVSSSEAGETPLLAMFQYTYARAASVLRKTGITEVGEIDPSLVTDETSVALLKEIERFPVVIKVAADRLEPSVISRYVMGVAQSFNRFYHENQCNVEDQKLKEARVKIVILAKQVIKDGLDLLGIQCPEQM